MIKTTKATVTKKGGLWAVPKYEIKPGEFPFNYELSDSASYHWNNRAILVQEVELSAEVPEGIDLFSRAIETVSVKEAEALKQYNEAMAQLAEMRKSLLLLAAPTPEPEGTYEILLVEEAESNGPGQDFEYVEGGIVLEDGTFVSNDDMPN